VNQKMLHGIQDIDRHPIAELNSNVEQIPVIDVADVLYDSSSNAALIAIDQIAEACKTWGFFQIVNHGIASTQIEEVWNQTHALFALPIEEKLDIERSRKNPWGFYNRELTKNQRDKKQVFDFTRQDYDPIYRQSNRWPQRHPQFKVTLQAYMDACNTLALKLLEAFCLGLDLPADFRCDTGRSAPRSRNPRNRRLSAGCDIHPRQSARSAAGFVH
jgi:isopenicillin N synthase-like dioxygenase